jgi:tetratricopeptide (TPR) repeat protein
VLALHSFWFEEAEEAFKKAQQIDPAFALAYWGEAMSHNHPLWAEQDLAAARAALARLGTTPQDRAAKARTEREKAYLEAVEILYGEGNKLDRDRAYSKAMGRLAERFPDDDEAKVLYALSLLGTVRPGEKGFSRQMKSAAILADVEVRNPRHPGVAHFTIHSFDDPEHAPLSLKAADLYAEIAPEAPHALHMPTHIYIQLGMWPRVVSSNEAAYAASVKWVERKGLSRAKQDFHSLAWGQYGTLQLGQYDKARDMVPIAEEVGVETGDSRAQAAAASMRARYVVESRRFSDLPLPEPLPAGARTSAYSSQANQLVAAGHSAAHLGRHDKAREAAERLRSIAQMPQDNAYDAQPIEIMALQLEGLSMFLKGDEGPGLERLAEAAKLEERLDPPSGPTYPIKPSHELYAESLSLLGLARAALGSGDQQTAAEAYGQLAGTWASADPGRDVDEVKGFRPGTRVAAKP